MAKNTKGTIQPAQPQKSKRGKDTQQSCTLPRTELRPLPTGMPEFRARLIRRNEKKWVNGTELHYFFFDKGTDGVGGNWVGSVSDKQAVRDAFDQWKSLPLGLKFTEVTEREDAELRIGFDQSDGSWSYVGRDAIDHVPDPNERTMNFGWSLTTPYGGHTALHEIGHALGFPHEHQNPNAGIVWDEAAVYDYFRGEPNNWPDSTIEWNILRKLSAAEVEGSAWDPDSVMHYGFEPGLILQPQKYNATGLSPALGLSQTDEDEARKFYPALEESHELVLKPYESRPLLIEAGQQVDFKIAPEQTRRYTIQTFGLSDTVMVLFERRENGELRYIDGDDDSGYSRNARIHERLYRDREYVLKVRLYYSDIAGQTAVLMY